MNGRRLAWSTLILIAFVTAFALPFGILNGTFSRDPTNILSVAMLGAYAVVGALVATRLPGNPIGWLLLAVSGSIVIGGFCTEYATYGFKTNPGALPNPAIAAWISSWLFIGVAAVPLILLLFPTGRIPSPRWRLVPAGLFTCTGLLTLISMFAPSVIDVAPGVLVRNPYGVEAFRSTAKVVPWVAGPGLAALSIACAASLVFRYRRSSGDERQQVRWLAYAGGIACAALIFALVTSIGVPPQGSTPLNNASFVVLIVAIGIGIPLAVVVSLLKYRLYDLDLVIKKTMLYVSVAAVLVAVFLVVALIVGGLVGRTQTGTALAAGAIGLLFWPALRAARRVADRVVYGGRATPYEVLSSFAEHLSETYSTDDVLPRTARLLADATGAARAMVWLRVGGRLRAAGIWPSDADAPDPIPVDGGELPWLPAEWAEEVRDRGELLGALAVDMPANDPIGPTRQRLVRDLAGQAGLVLRNVRLIEELRDSRRRIVGAQDERAKRLERNIHDGAQQQLVALAVKLRLASSMVEADPPGARTLLDQLQTEANDALENLRDLARGIYPPLLADKGLAAAIEAQARKATVPTVVEMENVERYPQDVESAVYFCVLEALSNTAKYANASNATVALNGSDGHLNFEIRDDGAGFDPVGSTHGTGLQGIADRLDAIGGTVQVRSAPGAGTTIVGSVAVAERSS